MNYVTQKMGGGIISCGTALQHLNALRGGLKKGRKTRVFMDGVMGIKDSKQLFSRLQKIFSS